MQSILRVLAKIGIALLCILAFLFSIIFFFPLTLLPKATAVPMPVWVLLMAAGLFALSLQFWIKPIGKGIGLSLAGALAVTALGVAASQMYATTPPITDAQGNPVPGSIATLEKMTLNGSQQWVSIRGKDATNPVLLFLAGGPGGSQMSTERLNLPGLEDHFVVVNWDQPGAGKSFDSVDRSKITVERYIEDGHELVLQLRERFKQDKIYLVGESWGSVLGVLLVQRYPELFQAMVGTGQMVAFIENDRICYEFALNWARERGDTAKVEKLLKQGPPPYNDKNLIWEEAAFLLDTYDYMNQNPQINDNGSNTWRDLAAPEYGLYDKVSWFRGGIETLGIVYPQLWDVDFRKQATKLDVPVYFLIGRHDINAPVKLAQEYYDLLDAPHKEIVWFEHSGHNPWVNEAPEFERVMVEKVLAETRD